MLTSEVRPAEARFELTLAFHCAPALAGIKPADLIALPGEGDETDALLASYSAALAGAGISLRPLCRCRSRCLVLVYRRDRLERQLEQEEVARLLERDGYPLAGGLEAMLDHLASRMAGAVGSPMRWGCSWDIPPRMWRAFAGMAARAINTAGCGRSIPTWRGPRDASGSTAAAEGPCAAAWRPAAGWSSCFGQLDGDRG